MKRKKTGIFGGSFDPIHIGHLQLALFLREQGGLDEVFFIPAHTSPFKIKTPPCASSQDRLQMIALAITPFPYFQVLDIECSFPSPSYTIDTVEKLISLYPDREFFLLLSKKSVERFSSWKEADKLVTLAFPLIAVSKERVLFPYPCKQFQGFDYNVSSTLVRDRLQKRFDCKEFVPAPSLNYIFTNHLYGT